MADGEKLASTPEGSRAIENETPLLKPPPMLVETRHEKPPPCVIVTPVTGIETVRVGEVTVRPTSVLSEAWPWEPVMVRTWSPGAAEPVLTDRVDVSPGSMISGENRALLPGGSPLMLSVTGPTTRVSGMMVTAKVVDEPLGMVRDG